MSLHRDALSREFAFTCDAGGRIVEADERSRRRVGFAAGGSFMQAAAPGTGSKMAAFLQRAGQQLVEGVELPVVAGGRVITCAFSAQPGEAGLVEVLGSCLPQEHGDSIAHLQESMAEIVELNREVTRQKAQIARQNAELERVVRELDDSNKGITSLHQELADKAEVLQRSAELKSRVVANVSHEFRTPLHTILGLSRLLLETPSEPLSAEQRTQIEFIRSSAEELSSVVDDMLDLSSVESGKAVLRPEKIHVRDVFAALRGALRPLLPSDSQVSLTFEEPPDDLWIDTDHAKLAQVLRNLVSNALKFTQQGSITVAVRDEGGTVAFSVADTGIGIAREHFERIFEEFGQVDGPIQRTVKGTGLGLALSRRLASLLGGSLTVASEVGSGSTFTLNIPRVHPEVRELNEIEGRPLDPNRSQILVVEDDRKTIFIYERFLAMSGFQVVPARSIQDAERLLGTMQPSAIVLDIMLDGESSWNFLTRIKQDERTRDIPVLVVTVTNKEQKARALGADEFWVKPVDKDRLLRKLRSVKGVSGGSVLFIDDDERSRYLVRKYLENTPYQLIEADNGTDGVLLARRLLPGVILLDFLLRGSTAFDVLDELKADPVTRQIPVIVITSHKLGPEELERLQSQTEIVLSKESLSRELAIHRIRDALKKGGMVQ